MDVTWTEEYAGGSPEAERLEFAEMAKEILDLQLTAKQQADGDGVVHGVQRAFHARSTFVTTEAELRFLDLPADLAAGFARSGRRYPTTVRFSNAAGKGAPDFEPDLRGVALRVTVDHDEQHDLLMTNFPTSHARDARQFVAFAVATAGGTPARVAGLAALVARFGPFEVARMLRNVLKARGKRVRGVASETYWSRGAIRWGSTLAVRYLLRPEPGSDPGPEPSATVPDYLSREMADRLTRGDVRLELCVQRYIDARRTPIEDTAVEWTEAASPPVPVAILTIPRRRLDAAHDDAEALVRARGVDDLSFNPWNTTDGFRPLGNLNRARKAAYDASAAHRLGTRWASRPPVRNVVVGAAVRETFGLLNRLVEWHRWPVPVALLNLEAFRLVLRRANLIDTEPHEAPPQVRPVPSLPPEDTRAHRTFVGTDNDLSEPQMGAIGAAFGRNLAPDLRPDLFDEPNPITVSDRLLARDSFRPAPSLNLLAAAWIQFQVHDWVHHARSPLGHDDVRVPLPEGVPSWVNVVGGDPEAEMRIGGNIPLDGHGGDAGQAPVFGNTVSHWWDGSEVYGSDPISAEKLRDGPKLRLTAAGYLPEDVSGMEITGFNESWWLGLSTMHTLFAREHNLLCDELRAQYRSWSDDRVYHTARLVVAALIAKIHTVEWTPAILGTRAIDLGLHSNWNGPPADDLLSRLGLWLVDAHSLTGIPSTKPDHHGVPFSLTEDFVTVYRMHPLLPDDYVLLDHEHGGVLGRYTFPEIQGGSTDELMRSTGLENVLFSFGVANPGAISLHNFPRSLRTFERDGERVDLAVADLVRTRRRGVPRYNDFRAGLHKPRIRRWEDFPSDPDTIAELREVYGSVDRVDTMVGLFAETPPPGFGFSDTAFRIFILMASRRLQSDRFLTADFRPEVYSPFGMDWIARTGMKEIVLRHCPELATMLPPDASAFAPWRIPAAHAAPQAGSRR
ncbi:peroxidase family protein [Actinomycetospora sp.]|uniref:peroxidase family protein n=1 Tax=Actinomycetospora sp. TaxID=1872135 RepID=UPI002F3FDB7A